MHRILQPFVFHHLLPAVFMVVGLGLVATFVVLGSTGSRYRYFGTTAIIPIVVLFRSYRERNRREEIQKELRSTPTGDSRSMFLERVLRFVLI